MEHNPDASHQHGGWSWSQKWPKRRGQQHTSARKARKRAQRQGAEHHRCKVPMYCSNRGSAGPSEKVATPATECEVELLKGGRIVSIELKTKRRAPEDMSDENGRREGEKETFTKAPGTGLVKETIPAGAEKVDVREQSGRPRRGPKIIVADLVGPTPNENRQRTPQACTVSRAI